MQSLYPLRFKPIFKEKIWGGQNIKDFLGMNVGDLPNCGEVWLISGVEGEPTIVSNGYLAGNELNELVEVFMGDLVGDKIYEKYGDVFPILLKLIDANDWLSVQVHPDDKLAHKRGTGYGKTEMWYILHTKKNASLIAGFNKQVDKHSFIDHLNNGNIKQILNYEKVNKGDVYYIPAGRVHALGPGCLLAEIQQTSDTTYRIYDWDRIDDKGNKRQLHIAEAMDAIDFGTKDAYKTDFTVVENDTSTVVKSPFFVTNFIKASKPIQKDYSELDSFVILMCIEGKCSLKWDDGTIDLDKPYAVLIPNMIDKLQLVPDDNAELLEIYIE
jgi:mannose-6-phosphate isomerase